MWFSLAAFRRALNSALRPYLVHLKNKKKTYLPVKKRSEESLWWWELEPVSVWCKQNLVIYTAELMRHFLSLLAAPNCSTSCMNNAEELLLLFSVCLANHPLCCAFVKGKLQVNAAADSTDFIRRSCLKKTAIHWLSVGKTNNLTGGFFVGMKVGYLNSHYCIETWLDRLVVNYFELMRFEQC